MITKKSQTKQFRAGETKQPVFKIMFRWKQILSVLLLHIFWRFNGAIKASHPGLQWKTQHELSSFTFCHINCKNPYNLLVISPQELSFSLTLFVSVCRKAKAETQASWEDHGYLIDFHFRNNTMLKRQLEKYLRSSPAVSHKPTTSGHSSQTTRILWGQRWLVRSLNFVLWNILNSFGHFREVKSRKL